MTTRAIQRVMSGEGAPLDEVLAPDPAPVLAPLPDDPGVSAVEFEREHGYPPDAVIQEAGEYVVIMQAVSVPDGDDTRTAKRGERVQLTTAQATRFVHLGAVAKESQHNRQRIDALRAEAERLQRLADEAQAEAERKRAGATQSYRDDLAGRRQRIIRELPALRAAVDDALRRIDEYTAEIAEIDQADPTLDKTPERWGRNTDPPLWQGRKIPTTEAEALAEVR